MVEDNEDGAELLLRELRRGDFEVVCERVQTCSAMAAALARGPWNLVVSDFSMPEFDALRALAVLKESGVDLPFIVLSGTVSEQNAVDALRAGAHDFINKGKLARLLPAIDRELREARVRKAQREAEQRHRRIVETTNEGICMVDGSSNTTFVNARMASLLGLSRDDLLGKSIVDFVHDDSCETLEAMFARRDAGSADHSEIRLVRDDGSDVWALVDSTPIFDGVGGDGGARGLFMGISHRKHPHEGLALT